MKEKCYAEKSLKFCVEYIIQLLCSYFFILVDRARASFRQSLRLGSRGRRGLRLAGYLTPPSDVTAAEEEADTLEQW